MSLLEQWQAKPSWQETYSIVPCYVSMRTGEVDLDMRALCRKEPELTLSLKGFTGFSEIGVVPAEFFGNRGPPTIAPTITGISRDLNELIVAHLRKTWNSRDYHLILCSAGQDSQIIACTLFKLQEEGFDLGDFHFLCHEPEHVLFEKVMAGIGWDDSQCRVYKAGHEAEPNYYDIRGLDHNFNGFTAGNPMFYNVDVDPSECCLVTGLFHNALTDYVVFNEGSCGKATLGQFLKWTYFPQMALLERYANWADLLYPLMDWDYVNYLLHVPREFFVQFGERDLIRATMLKEFGIEMPFYWDHDYNLRVTPAFTQKINDDFHASKLCEDYALQDVNPGGNIYEKQRVSTKLYGLAGMYEGI